MTDCMACDVLAGLIEAPGGVIHESEHWSVDHAFPRWIRGWLIVKPKRHVEHLAELSPAEAAELGPLIRETAAAVAKVLAPERVYVLSLGEEVHHVHLHVIPRYGELPANVLSLLEQAWGKRSPWECTGEEAASTAGALREELRA
jgi:diadenosine tetraphosphate (Ap4A) HIT family hydrolase